MFAASLLESLAVVGTFIPGSTVVFAGGVLIGLRVIDPALVLGAAVIGAIVGDAISYTLGRSYREQIPALWPLNRYPELLDRGRQYFGRHGGKSVFLGRFLSPVRAIVPVVAGMSAMPAARFYFMNVLSAFAWAGAHLIPGALFGASLQLAGAVSSRLVILLVTLVIALWLMSRLVRLALGYGWPRVISLRDRIVVHARSRSGRLARIVLSLFDPTRPESSALLVAAILLIGGLWLFFGILEDVVSKDPLVAFDLAVYGVLQGVRTGWVDQIMVAVTEIGGAAGTVSVVIAVSAWLLVKRAYKTFGYWLATIGFSEILVLTLKYTLGRVRPNELYTGVEQFSFPSGHAAASIVVYGFLAFLLARGKPVRQKMAITLVAAVAIILIAASRVYLGAHWFSDVLASLSFGLAWVALLGIAYTHHVRNEVVRARPLALIVATTLVLVGAVYVRPHHEANVARYTYQPRSEIMPLDTWKAVGWRTLPAARSDLAGEIEEPFSVQWVGTQARIEQALTSAQWQVSQPWSIRSVLLWLLPDPAIDQLAVLPKFERGEAQQLTFARVMHAHERLVIRLWRRPESVVGMADAASQPLWVGMVTRERLRHPLGMFTLATTLSDFESSLTALERSLRTQGFSDARRDGDEFSVLLVW